MTVSRRLSQAISEGDGISVIVHVSSVAEARAAEADGAEALAITVAVPGLRGETALPILWRGEPDWAAAAQAGADACVVLEHVDPAEPLEPVVYVADEEGLAAALEDADPEVFLLGAHDRESVDVEEVFEAVLDLLPDVPAGKLAIAEVAVRTRDEVEALERAGMDGVLVQGGNVAALVGGAPPEV